MTDTKNIIIIGKVGSGKSTLANVLSGTKVFKEISSSSIEIWKTKNKVFKVEELGKIKYRVIDTVGLGSKILNEKNKKELLEKFEEEIGTYIDEGISQIFLLIGKKLDEKILGEFLWLNKYLFDNKALDYTTIVRTNFTDFKDKEKCEKEIKSLVNSLTHFFNEVGEDKEVYEEVDRKIIEKKIVCIDNPPITEPDEEDDEDDLKLRELNKEVRKKSREVLLNCLNNFSIKESYRSETRKWLDENYSFEDERKEITVLDISKQNLKGRLNLEGFTNLKRLNCADNQLTNLDLSGCPNLVELKCNDNQLINLNFLKNVANLEKLEVQNNKNLSPHSLKVLIVLSKLKLEELNIDNTNINEGWKCLLKNCQKLYCNNLVITEQLDQKKCLVQDEEKKYYDLEQWRLTDKQNKLTASVIPLERLFVIRSNIKKFTDKWGVKEDNNENKKEDSRLKNCLNWPYNKISKLWKKEEILSELSKLKNPTDASWQWWTNTTVQWTNRAALVAGGSLVLVGQSDTTDPNSQTYTQIGGIIAIAGPFVETLTSYINDKILEVRQAQWDDFITDTKNLLDNYHELLGILEKIEKKDLGKVNETLNNLRKVTKVFLDEYDKEDKKNDIRKNGVIDIDELIEDKPREKFAKDLNEEKKWPGSSQLGRIVKMMKKLEEEIINHRQESSSVVHKQDKETLLNNQKQNLAWIIIDLLNNYAGSEFNIEEEYNTKGRENNNWNGKSAWTSYLANEITSEKELAEKKVNLLLPLVEIIVERLGKTDIEVLLTDQKHEKKIVEFLKNIEGFCAVCGELEDLEDSLLSLKSKVVELRNLEKESGGNEVSDKVSINMDKITEEKKGLEKIIEKLSNLDENLKDLHAKLINRKGKEDIEYVTQQEHIDNGYGFASGSKN